MLCILCGQGHMSYQDMLKECQSENWLPVLVMRMNGQTILPMFPNERLAAGFIRRNLPKEWTTGVIAITSEDADQMDEKGWKAIEFTFPRKVKDIVEFDVEVIECKDVAVQRKAG